jgi:ribonuclease PH
MLRAGGRTSTQLRPLRLTPNYTKQTPGSVLIELGETKVICTVSVEESLPPFLRNVQPAQGWLTAEYSMLPGSSAQRIRRERQSVSGRTQEIQRLIGRSLRGIVDLTKMPDMTITIDCDVIQADGGTRTASITGAYAALKMAIDKLLQTRKLHQNPIIDGVAAVSIGMRGGELLVDLDYKEDSSADLDMNVVMTQSGKILEIQGTAERAAFSKSDVVNIIEAAEEVLKPVFELQHAAADGRIVES